ncbi:hypothetical protein ABEB36_000006 [Hypothenemus hampei]|uniref:Uncharacterized protein n=1 Tax=Hypothenemus hampei TaxID=57062 RepID=A0ABD1FA09_HYPHA
MLNKDTCSTHSSYKSAVTVFKMISHDSRNNDTNANSSSFSTSPICYDREIEECLQKFEDAARRESYHLLNTMYCTDTYQIECGLSPALTFSSVVVLSQPTQLNKITFSEFEWASLINVLEQKIYDFFDDPTVPGDVVTFPCGDFVEVSQMIGFNNTDGDFGKVLKILKHAVNFYLTENDVLQILHTDLSLIRPRLTILNDLNFCSYYHNSWCNVNNVDKKDMLEWYILFCDTSCTGNMLLISALREYIFYYNDKVLQNLCKDTTAVIVLLLSMMDSIQNVIDFLAGNKDIKHLTSEDLKCLPLDYYLNHIHCMNLLNIWSKLPYKYTSNYKLQVRLPCFVHYNQPGFETHIDGPPLSQNTCPQCLQASVNQCNFV